MKIIYIFILLFSFKSWGQNLYLAPALTMGFSSGDSEAKSSLLGPGIALSAGARFGVSMFEIEYKRFKFSGSQIGSPDYDTQVYDSIFSGGLRVLLNNIFSIKAGLAIHHFEMDIFKDDIRQENIENEGEFIGFYAGMGIAHNISKMGQLFLESTLYPVSEVNLFIVDMQVGYRIYL